MDSTTLTDVGAVAEAGLDSRQAGKDSGSAFPPHAGGQATMAEAQRTGSGGTRLRRELATRAGKA